MSKTAGNSDKNKDNVNPSAYLQNSHEKRLLIISAWTAMLVVSDLPDILWNVLFGQAPAWLFLLKIGLLIVFFCLCLIWKGLRPLRQYVFVFLIFYLALGISTRVGNTSWWQSRFNGPHISFTLGYLGVYFRDFGVALAVIIALWVMKRRRSEFFLAKGQLDAPIEPVRWLGIGQGKSWKTFGWIFALAASVAVLIPVMLSLKLSSEALRRAVPLIPSVLLFAAINAFTEEIYFRASFLSTLCKVIGKTNALLISAVFFGLAHYLYGSPPGVIGFMMTGFLAWLLGKSMLETKGMFWPWFIHFLPDVIVFASYAVLFIQT